MEVTELIEAIDIVDYISQFVELEEKNGEFWGISPFTYPPERTPSFSVRRETNQFYDFSSGVGGNVLTFITKLNNVSVHEGIEVLKKYAGVKGDTVTSARLAATKVALKYAQRSTDKSYDTSTMPADYMDRYDFDKDKLRIWYEEGIPYDIMYNAGVRYDQFSERIVYPIRNINGDIINVSGRTIDPLYKEKGFRKYTYFKSLGAVPTIYGLSESLPFVKEQKEIILFEGAKSVLLARSWGINNTGAALTSHLSPRQFEILLKLGVSVTFAFDSDVNIREDTNIQKLIHYLPVYWVKNRDGLLAPKDSPVDKGREVFQTLYDRKIKY